MNGNPKRSCVLLLLCLPLSITPSLLQLHDLPLLLFLPARWGRDLWLVEPPWLCRHSPGAHSSEDLGVVLRISFAAGPISPFPKSAQEGDNFLEEISFLLHLCHILWVPARFFAVCSVFGSVLGFGWWGRRCAWLENFERKLAVFVQSFDRSCSFVAPEAWEETSPKPLEKRKPRWKNLAKARPWLQRRTDRYFAFLIENKCDFSSRLLQWIASMACSMFPVASPPRTTLTRHSGKVATCDHFRRRALFFLLSSKFSIFNFKETAFLFSIF